MSSNIKITRICQHCCQEFIAKTTVTKYCGDVCAKRAYKEKVRKQKIKESEAETNVQRNKYSVPVSTAEYLTVKDVSSLLKCDPRTIYSMIKGGRLNAINLSARKTRILKRDIDELFYNQLASRDMQRSFSSVKQKPAIKDCYSIGEILIKYKIAESTLRRIVSTNKIPKYNEGKFVYIPKYAIDPFLKRFIV